MTRVYVGTCSWADHTNFYPPELPKNQQIIYYSQNFSVVEIDSSFYRLMPVRNYQLWAERTPPGFLFDVKPFRQLTGHDRETPATPETVQAFTQSVQPLRDAGKLGAIHMQFPPWFAYNPKNVDYLRGCREWFPNDRLSIEFRHRSWLTGDHVPELLETFNQYHLSLTVVDEPQLGSGSIPTLLSVTNPELVIVRFHGRNYKKWYAKVERTADRFDYLYSEEELQEWVPNVATLAEGTHEMHLLFNNNRDDYAVRNAGQLRGLIQASLPSVEVVVPSPSGPVSGL
jgi:uncharacterized protein YecE (DUF72 family)